MNKIDIENIISISFQTNNIPSPLSIIVFIAEINQRGGIITLNHWRILGIFSIGKINPDRRIVGKSNPTIEINMAICCVFTAVEIRIPRDNARRIKIKQTPISKPKLPLIGNPNTVYPISRITSELVNAKPTYGSTFPRIICVGRKGETRRISIVPSSFSLAMEIDVIIAVISIRISAIVPGTNMKTDFIS